MDYLQKIFSDRRKVLVISLSFFFIILLVLSLGIASSRQKPLPQESTAIIIPSPTQVPLIPGKDYVVGQTMVKFKQDIPQSVIDEKLKQYDSKIIESIRAIGASVLEVPAGREQEIVGQLTNDGFVEYADLNYMYEDRWTPNDPQFGSQWGLKMIKAPEAWDVTRGKGITIADIQNGGADVKHPDLAPNVISGNGSNEHGTHTAGIMAAAGNNGQGVAGTCPECKLMMLNVQGYSDASVSQAIITAADGGAKAVNMSFGGPRGGKVLTDAINYAWGKGCIGVAASGNEGQQTLGGPPGSLPLVVNVASTDNTDKKASSSNYHSTMTIAAPGKGIMSTLPGGRYGNMSGTSMASPMVAGVIGLIWSTKYGTSSQAVVDRLCNTADKITGTGTQWKCGRVNAFNAVAGGEGAAAAPVETQPTQALQPTAPVTVPSFACLGSCPTSGSTTQSVPLPNTSSLPSSGGGGQGVFDQIIALFMQFLQSLLGR